MKKGPLSKKEKSYIEKNLNKKTMSEISAKLNRSKSVVEKYSDTLVISAEPAPEPAPEPQPVAEVVEQQAEPENKVRDVSDMFAKKKDRGVTVMTEAAATASDENKQVKRSNNISPPRYHKHIHRIKD